MIHYIKGDATKPTVKGTRIIVHVCNDLGGWGSGFVLALNKRWPEPKQRYKELSKSQAFSLGRIQIVPVQDEHGPLFVVNMVAQHKYACKENPVALRYEALEKCLKVLNDWVFLYQSVQSHIKVPDPVEPVTIHMPRIGCGLAGGSWDKVEKIIESFLDSDVYVYDLM